MSERTIVDLVLREPPLVDADEPVAGAIRRLLDSDLPALPVIDAGRRYAGIFGEREFMAAVFPGYVTELRGAAFLTHSIDAALERRDACRDEPVSRYMCTEHVEVGPDPSDIQLAEIFFHHRVLVVPIVEDGTVTGLITRHAFFRAVAQRFLDQG
jgi:CBS domain-containing protein